jgi:allantoicase
MPDRREASYSSNRTNGNWNGGTLQQHRMNSQEQYDSKVAKKKKIKLTAICNGELVKQVNKYHLSCLCPLMPGFSESG